MRTVKKKKKSGWDGIQKKVNDNRYNRIKDIHKRSKEVIVTLLLFAKKLLTNTFPKYVVVSVITRRCLCQREYYSFLLFLSLLFAYIIENNIMAVLKSIFPQGPDWITPPCSSFLTIVSCVCVCVTVCMCDYGCVCVLLPDLFFHLSSLLIAKTDLD